MACWRIAGRFLAKELIISYGNEEQHRMMGIVTDNHQSAATTADERGSKSDVDGRRHDGKEISALIWILDQ
jgi:hypothetical protein